MSCDVYYIFNGIGYLCAMVLVIHARLFFYARWKFLCDGIMRDGIGFYARDGIVFMRDGIIFMRDGGFYARDGIVFYARWYYFYA